MGVVGAVQTQAAQPVGQVPLTGSKQPVNDGPCVTEQQSCPVAQQLPAQQNWPWMHWAPTRLQGGAPQVPFAQYGCAPEQGMLQPPQLRMSFLVLTQNPPQQLKPWQSVSV
jgi:hypothetical protein